MLAFLGYLTADLAVRLLPARLADCLAVALARLVFATRPRARGSLEANLARLLPGVSDAERRGTARAAFEHFALSLTDFLRLGRLDGRALERAIEVRGGEHLERARASGRGVILLSAHAGNWEWGAAWLAARVARLHVVARPHPNRWVERLFARRREARGVALLPGRPLWPGAARALKRREWVALMGDRRGACGSVCAWAAALSRRTGAVVLPAVMLRLAPGRYAACFEPPLSPEACAGGGYRDALRPHFERHPEQWFAFEPLTEGLA
ncbi:MAG: lysophospholipid acyltransferase family protein [Candidatus Eisenbacteria bacterium]